MRRLASVLHWCNCLKLLFQHFGFTSVIQVTTACTTTTGWNSLHTIKTTIAFITWTVPMLAVVVGGTTTPSSLVWRAIQKSSSGIRYPKIWCFSPAEWWLNHSKQAACIAGTQEVANCTFRQTIKYIRDICTVVWFAFLLISIFGRPFVKRFALCYRRCLSCLSCL